MKKCPFCGAEGLVEEGGYCSQCGARGPHFLDRSETWNTRPEEDRLAAELAAAQAEIKMLKELEAEAIVFEGYVENKVFSTGVRSNGSRYNLDVYDPRAKLDNDVHVVVTVRPV